MGIDIYARWDGQTEAEREAQITGFAIDAGRRGYLRESIGGVHAVTWLVPEAFGDAEDARSWYDGAREVEFAGSIAQALGGKVTGALVEMTERAGGFPPDGYLVPAEQVQVIDPRWPDEPQECYRIPSEVLRRRLPLVQYLCERRYEGDGDAQRASARSVREFVDLIERLENEGRNPSVYVSY